VSDPSASARPSFHRTIRSFVRRQGRLTPGQQRALEILWPHFGVDNSDSVLDLAGIFACQAPVFLEIGFGNGESLAAMASQHPENNYLGIEVHRPGIGRLLLRLEEQGIENVRVICDDATQVLSTRITDGALDGILIFFPDPWPKKRHHKRRLIQPAFVQALRPRLKVGAMLHTATDWQDYAEQMMSVLSHAEGFENQAGVGRYADKPDYRPQTKFERRGLRLGHGVWDLVFRRIS